MASFSRLKRNFLITICFFLFTFVIFVLVLNFKGFPVQDDTKQHKLNYLSSLGDEQHKRLSHLADSCAKLKLKSLPEIRLSRLDHLIVDDANKLIYCFVPKVACTNWRRVLLALRSQAKFSPLAITGNETHLPNIFVTLDQVPRNEAIQKLFSYTKFVFVRHPYERLISAYRNKFEHAYSDYFHSRFGRKIIKMYRQNATAESLSKGHDVTFEEFLRYITELNRTADHGLFNEHWRPITDLCYPCGIKYDIIGKYETLLKDAEFTLWKTGIWDKVVFPRRDQSYNRKSSAELAAEYFAKVDARLWNKIAHLYRYDLEAFEYTKEYFAH